MDLERANKRINFLKQEIDKYKKSIESTQRFLMAAEDELDDLTAAIIEEEEKQKKAKAVAKPKDTMETLFDQAVKKEARDVFTEFGTKLFGKPQSFTKRMEFGVIEDGNGGVVYTYGKNTPVIDKIVKMLSDKLPDEVF